MNPTSTPGHHASPGNPPSEGPLPSDPGAALKALDAELDRAVYATTLEPGDSAVACMTVANRHAGLSEEVYCNGLTYYWEWGQIIAAVGNPKAAAAKVSYVLATAPGTSHD